MRTKLTGRRGVNGVAQKPPKGKRARSQTPRLPTAPAQELSEHDTSKIKDFLDRSDKPFTVATVPASRKRKRSSAPLQVENDLFEPRLSVQYEVKPRGVWEALRKYKKFTVGAESIAAGQCILVKHDESEEARMDVDAQWKAKVLEVRALDPEHVYIRVAWLNRPEDLDSGRKPYHGKDELIPTNQIDIIDAMAVNGAFEVSKWEESADEDESSMPAEDQYFWRQTYDQANTKTFSRLRQICVDDAPQNPDELIVQCANGDCRKWMHVKCIAEIAVQRASDEASVATEHSKKASAKETAKPRSLDIDPSSSAVAKAEKGAIIGEVFLHAYSDTPAAGSASENEVVVTSPDGEQHSERVCCLFCGSELE